MSNVCIHYFSGTGNTQRAARLLEADLTHRGDSVTLCDITKTPRPAEHFDAHIFMFCILSWSAPAMMKRYVRSLPEEEGARGAVIAIFGGSADYDGDAGQAVQQICGMLRRRGYEVSLSEGIAYPTNWVQFSSPPDKASCALLRERSDVKLAAFAERFSKGEKHLYRAPAVSRLLTKIPAFFFGLMGRRLLGKMFIADRSCTKCGLCAKSCPSKTISMNGPKGKPRWKANCENCNRCMNICPSESIQTSVPRLVLHLGLSVTAYIVSKKLALMLTALLPVAGIGSTLAAVAAAILIFTLLFIAQLTVVDRLILLLQFIPPVDAFFCLNFTKKTRRYKAPDFRV